MGVEQSVSIAPHHLYPFTMARLLAICGFVGVKSTNDVTLHPKNFYNFQTDFQIEGKRYMENFGQFTALSDFNNSGSMHFSIDSQVVNIELAGRAETAVLRGWARTPTGVTVGESGHGGFFLDMKNRKVVVRAHSKLEADQMQAGADYEFCVAVDLPPLPPQENPFLRVRQDPYKTAMAETWEYLQGKADLFPHEVEDGGVRYRLPPHVEEAPYPTMAYDVDVTPDGIPTHFATFYTCTDECFNDPRFARFLDSKPEIDVWFDHWNTYSEEGDVPSCAEGASTDLSAFPQAAKVIAAYDVLMQPFSEQAAMGPLVLQQMQLSSKSKTEADRSSTVGAFVVGVSCGAFLFVVAAVFTRKNLKSEPLLSVA